jgi:5'-phosphate synthase pdxT subunit
MITVGVLAFHGDVIEHIEATKLAAKNLHQKINVREVRTKEQVKTLDALIIPGGESTTLHMLCEREGMWEHMKKIRYIFGTCAGAIMLAKTIHHKAPGQKTLERMDIEVDRNAYGRQSESFEKPITTSLGKLYAVFIRAPRITKIGKNVNVLAKDGEELIACEQIRAGYYNLAVCFHPELTSPLFHEYFLKKITG